MNTKKNQNVRYYAVADPHDATRMTYWREANGRRKPWPAKSHWAPRVMRGDMPVGLSPQEQTAWYSAWRDRVASPWYAAVHAAIEAEPQLSMARFATLQWACCICKRALTEPASVAYGIGPDCRSAFPDGWLEQMAEAVSRAHAEILTDSVTAHMGSRTAAELEPHAGLW